MGSKSGLRAIYGCAFFLLLAAELLIALLVNDRFIRPYVGDILVAVLLCCLVKAIWPQLPMAALWVLLFCAAAETVQLLDLPARLGLEGTVLEIALGAIFDWKDLLCYLIGCLFFAAVTYRKERPDET